MQDNTDRLEARVGRLLVARRMTVALAESCTGGLIAHYLTNVPGSSEYFLGGVVAYSNQAKEDLLGVQHSTILTYGAVSEPVAQEMARGARRIFGADVALSVTGIAGPGGGTPEKPVGLTYIALSAADAETSERHIWHGDRWQNKDQSAQAALRLLQRYLEGANTIVQSDPDVRQPTSVEARFDEHSRVTPLSFTWRERRLPVAAIGRRWTDEVEGRPTLHVLVMSPADDVFELCLDLQTHRWEVCCTWEKPITV